MMGVLNSHQKVKGRIVLTLPLILEANTVFLKNHLLGGFIF